MKQTASAQNTGERKALRADARLTSRALLRLAASSPGSPLWRAFRAVSRGSMSA
ncbi:hypothetical protein AB4Y45_13865 [Paraburkholderia sp. EG287A]|uniref:hypothetical protein n=1 Tax=unclassified Paraburkholderia TaxID=2615204 RepID=UPI0034D2638A